MGKIVKTKDGIPGLQFSTTEAPNKAQQTGICPICHKAYAPFVLNGQVVCANCKRGISGCCGR